MHTRYGAEHKSSVACAFYRSWRLGRVAAAQVGGAGRAGQVQREDLGEAYICVGIPQPDAGGWNAATGCLLTCTFILAYWTGQVANHGRHHRSNRRRAAAPRQHSLRDAGGPGATFTHRFHQQKTHKLCRKASRSVSPSTGMPS